jgi:hypothetical protein
VRLSNFTIKSYKIIDDSGSVKVDPLVTALVGKNESGKSAVMRAMWKSKNVAGATFDKLLDFPRDRYSRERAGTQEVTRLEFALSDAEQAELKKALPGGTPGGPTSATLTTYYEGRDKTNSVVSCDWDLTGCPTGGKAFAAIETIVHDITREGESEAVKAAADANAKNIALDGWIWEPKTVAAIDAIETAIVGWGAKDPEKRQGVASSERATLTALVARAKQGDPRAAARKWIEENLPTFIYFDQYGMLTTLIHLPGYIARTAKPDTQTRTQTALFEWSGLDPNEILHLGRPREQNESEQAVQRRLEERRALLKSASFSLTGDWVKWWGGGEHRLEFDVDGEYLVLQVSDSENPFPIPFEERSQGLQWFFSFYLVFLVESKKAHKGAILLLDEPGLHLHPTLQMRLIAFFDRVAEENQLIYSTHLPFLVDGNHLERVRTVHLTKTIPAKTVVSTDVRPTGDKDTLFPLQAALGYSIAQTLFLGKRTIIVEGITDYWIIKALDACIAAEGKGALHEETVLVPAGGTSKLMPLASVMLASMQGVQGRMAVLLDSDTEGKRAAKRLEEAFGAEAPVLMLGTAISRADATIEDIVPRDVYLDALNRAGHLVKLNAEESKEPMIVHACEKAFQRLGKGKFGIPEKTAAAQILMDDWGKDPGKVPAETKAAARALIDAINAHFAR